jgi:hypothetical protein
LLAIASSSFALRGERSYQWPNSLDAPWLIRAGKFDKKSLKHRDHIILWNVKFQGFKVKRMSLVMALLLWSLTLIICQVGGVSTETDTNASALISHFNAGITYANASTKYVFGEVDVNLTRIPDQSIPVDGVTDFYKVELISNGKVIGSNIRGCTIGAGLSMDKLMGLSMSYGHIGTSTIDGNQTIAKWDVWYDPMNPTFIEPLAIRLSRVGWAIVNDNDTSINLNLNQEVQEVHLTKSDNSYTYGKPTQNIILTSVTPAPTTSPSPSPKETESFPATTAATFSLVIMLAIIAGLLVYFRRRKGKP